MVFSEIYNFIYKWLWLPIQYDMPYNPVDTTVWSLIFVFAVYLLYEYFFKRYKIKIDKHFLLALIGWIAVGSSLRVLEDVEVAKTFWLVTPFIYVITFAICFSSLLISRFLDKRKIIPYWKVWGTVGYVFAAINILMIPLRNWTGFAYTLIITLAWLGLFVLLRKILPKLFTWWNIAAIGSHMLDASASFIAVTVSGFFEKHVIGSYLALSYGTWTLFLMKLAVVPLAVFAIDKYCETDLEKKYLKMIIIILGLGIGLRNVLALTALG